MSDLFLRNRRLTVLAISLIIVSGLSSYYVLPRMEDPLLLERAAIINTAYPGADAAQVESLVTEPLEEELLEIEEIKEVRSDSRAGISTISIELRDDVYTVDEVWSRVRDRLDDARDEFPDGAGEPDFERLTVKAYALIVALAWDGSAGESPANFAILRRRAEQLKDRFKSLSGTEEVDLFGDPDEEIVVEVDSAKLAAIGLTVSELASVLESSDAKVSAGLYRGAGNDLQLEVSGELDSLTRIARTPIRTSDTGSVVCLSDVATVSKGIREPASSLAIINGRFGISLGMLVRPGMRVDHWSAEAHELLQEFEAELPPQIELISVFDQNEFVETRLAGLMWNLLLGGAIVALVIMLLMGWRSALVIGTSLPLAALMVLSGLRLLGIPIHQMSVTGLIIALGLLIDNAIVMVDEVSQRLRNGLSHREAVGQSVRYLAVPLFGSTLTTALAFGPIALMPGPAGEFVGSIAISVILAIFSSLFLAMTIIPALTAFARHVGERRAVPRIVRDGFTNARLKERYHASLGTVFGKPLLGIVLGLVLPLLGFLQARHLPEQFFPPADRNQFHIEFELPAQTSLGETLATIRSVRSAILEHGEVRNVHWFLGESAPSFYYNMIPNRRNVANFAQAFVEVESADVTRDVILKLQQELDQKFPQARTLVRQLEQGPPFDAPVELRLFGPDIAVLQELGEDIRRAMSNVAAVVHTEADLSESIPKVSFEMDEAEARLAGLDHAMIARQLEGILEGRVGGSLLEETEELPVRVRISNQGRSDLNAIASLDLVTSDRGRTPKANHPGVPLHGLADVKLEPELARIVRFNGQRMNEVSAYIRAGALPATVLSAVRDQLESSGFDRPHGYRLAVNGESAQRDNAIDNLRANVGVLAVLMVATLVLSFQSFRMAALIATVAILSIGLGLGALWVFGYPFGFMAIIGTMGLVGVAINDAIVVLAGLRSDPRARGGDPDAVREVVMHSTRHVIATSLTTMGGFLPLLISGGEFWPPLAIAIAGGVGGATILALYFVPSAYLLLMCRGCTATADDPHVDAAAEPAYASVP